MRFFQDPGEARHVELLVENDTAVSSTWSVSPSATLGSPTQFTEGDNGGSRVLFGPADAGSYVLTCNIVGNSGQRFERSIVIKVEELY